MSKIEQVEQCLEQIRPALAMHGGNVQLLDVVDGVVRVKLEGACKGCPMSQVTLKMGIEAEIISNVEGITEVIAVGDESEAEQKGCCADGKGDCCDSQSDEEKWFFDLLGESD